MSCPQRDAREEVQMWGGGGQRSSLWGRWVQWQLEGEVNHNFSGGSNTRHTVSIVDSISSTISPWAH